MANAAIFQSSRATNSVNQGGGRAYAMPAREALAQYAATGCFNGTYYATAESQLAAVLQLLPQVEPKFVAQVALHVRQAGGMKDMPALLVAWLAAQHGELAEAVFDRVIDNGKMLRNFVQMLRSGVVGRKSLGSRPKRMVQRWLERASLAQLLNASVGNQPSLADVVRMVHPKAGDKARNAFYAWLIGRPYDVAHLPAVLHQFEAFKRDQSNPLPKELPFQMLTALPLSTRHWAELARGMRFQALRMNLNTLQRHGVLDANMVREVAKRLVERKAIRASGVQPYQLLAAYRNAGTQMPEPIIRALEDAMEIAIDNVPELPGRVAVCVDVSGSMSSPISGYRQGATSAVRCIDVAALVGAALNRRNTDCMLVPFAEVVKPIRLNPRDSVASQAEALVRLGGGGTAIGAAMAWINAQKQAPDVVVVVSDNQSWADSCTGTSQTMREFGKLKARNGTAKLVCIDLQPYPNSQAPDRADVLNVGGFSDAVFEVIAQFVAHGSGARHWVDRIAAIQV